MRRCVWPLCGGFLDEDGFCIKCGRGDDLKHELEVKEKQDKITRVWKVCGYDRYAWWQVSKFETES